jgi:3-oxoacyl-[acyl-carrier protein] reductase
LSKLSDKVAIVTGASKGIGAGIARALAAAGASVVVNYASSAEAAEKVVDSITQSGGHAIAVQADISSEPDVRRLFLETQTSFGRLDILVNNAGACQFVPIEAVDIAMYNHLFSTNVLGPLLTCREAVKLFGDKGGSIINIGSAYSDLNIPHSAVYAASKRAVDSITAVLAKELGPRKIRVNSINPGVVDTEGARAFGFIGSDLQLSLENLTPLGRYGEPSDIAPIATFLASDDSRWLTGEHLVASGGLR